MEIGSTAYKGLSELDKKLFKKSLLDYKKPSNSGITPSVTIIVDNEENMGMTKLNELMETCDSNTSIVLLRNDDITRTYDEQVKSLNDNFNRIIKMINDKKTEMETELKSRYQSSINSNIMFMDNINTYKKSIQNTIQQCNQNQNSMPNDITNRKPINMGLINNILNKQDIINVNNNANEYDVNIVFDHESIANGLNGYCKINTFINDTTSYEPGTPRIPSYPTKGDLSDNEIKDDNTETIGNKPNIPDPSETTKTPDKPICPKKTKTPDDENKNDQDTIITTHQMTPRNKIIKWKRSQLIFCIYVYIFYYVFNISNTVRLRNCYLMSIKTINVIHVNLKHQNLILGVILILLLVI